MTIFVRYIERVTTLELSRIVDALPVSPVLFERQAGPVVEGTDKEIFISLTVPGFDLDGSLEKLYLDRMVNNGIDPERVGIKIHTDPDYIE